MRDSWEVFLFKERRLMQSYLRRWNATITLPRMSKAGSLICTTCRELQRQFAGMSRCDWVASHCIIYSPKFPQKNRCPSPSSAFLCPHLTPMCYISSWCEHVMYMLVFITWNITQKLVSIIEHYVVWHIHPNIFYRSYLRRCCTRRRTLHTMRQCLTTSSTSTRCWRWIKKCPQPRCRPPWRTPWQIVSFTHFLLTLLANFRRIGKGMQRRALLNSVSTDDWSARFWTYVGRWIMLN